MQASWKLKRTAQCAKCPWRVDVDPRDIPNGYCEQKHRDLDKTIAKPADLESLLSKEIHSMACHETDEAHCVGWLDNQPGPGNNLAIRLRMLSCSNSGAIRLQGDQHQTFEATLPSGATLIHGA